MRCFYSDASIKERQKRNQSSHGRNLMKRGKKTFFFSLSIVVSFLFCTETIESWPALWISHDDESGEGWGGWMDAWMDGWLYEKGKKKTSYVIKITKQSSWGPFSVFATFAVVTLPTHTYTHRILEMQSPRLWSIYADGGTDVWDLNTHSF